MSAVSFQKQQQLLLLLSTPPPQDRQKVLGSRPDRRTAQCHPRPLKFMLYPDSPRAESARGPQPHRPKTLESKCDFAISLSQG